MSESPSTRKDPRPPLREEDPRARAAALTAKLREHGRDEDEGVDKFYVDPNDVPPGWEYQWKTRTVYGKEDPAYQVSLARNGWAPVPASRHPDYMPMGYKGNTIERDGMMLMELPKELTDEARANNDRKARGEIRSLEEKLSGAPQGHFDRTSDPRVKPRIRSTFENIPIPE